MKKTQHIVRIILDSENLVLNALHLLKKEKILRHELESEIRRRVEFTRLLVHELKTPLTPIIATGDLITQIAQDEPLKSYAKNMFQGAMRLNRRIDELRDISKGETGILKLNCRTFGAIRVIKGICTHMLPDFQKKKQFFVQDLPGDEIQIRADEDRFAQILMNLLDNANKFTPDLGKVVLKALRSSGSLLIEIKDTGYGIKREKQKLLFQPYIASTDYKKRDGGLGLGLMICKVLVELHNGSISVDSRFGKGSTFSVSIPAV